ncbi:universal stress protein [Sphingomonas alba]|uniref:Universal stress protein n=1 Tax=Sphingomonas alba TaxID=2908208 RepID=A0ABT0RPT2_9SPHN|nr:universal stress protein [Sphingomonas alba]MCL6684472.1 universal stress protein [Sphingomonas alba]
MSAPEQLLVNRPAETITKTTASNAAPKTILVHIEDKSSCTQRLEHALSLARAFSAHISCLHVTPLEGFTAFDSFGGIYVVPEILKAIEEGSAELQAAIEHKLRGEDVTWDYDDVRGNIGTGIVRRAALADLVVTGSRPFHADFAGATVGLLGDLMCRTRTPLFISPKGSAVCDPTGPALVAWDGSYEAANSVRGTLGMLGEASSVHILQVEEEKQESFPGTRLLEFLSRHGIHAELTFESEPKMDRDLVPDMLVARAETVGASYLVMGGYSHSRTGEYLFGGVTRAMLKGAPLPIVIAH